MNSIDEQLQITSCLGQIASSRTHATLPAPKIAEHDLASKWYWYLYRQPHSLQTRTHEYERRPRPARRGLAPALVPPQAKPIDSLCALRSATRLLNLTSARLLSPPSTLRPLFSSHMPSVTVSMAARPPFKGSAYGPTTVTPSTW